MKAGKVKWGVMKEEEKDSRRQRRKEGMKDEGRKEKY